MEISATPRDLLLRARQHLLISLDACAVLCLARARRGGDPLLLGRERTLAGAFLLLLLRQALALLLQPGRVVALERIAAAALDLQDPAGDVVEEVAVVGDDHHGAGIVVQRVLQPGDAFGIEVVGRFVQQQQIRLLQQQPAQRDAPPLAAGQRGDGGVRRRTAQRIQCDVHAPVEVPALAGVDLRLQVRLFRQQRVHLLLAHGLGEFHGDFVEPVERGLQVRERLFHVLAHRLVGIELRLLLQVADARAFRRPRLAAEVGIDAGHDLHQRRFAGAVDAEYADLHAGQEGERDAAEHLAAAGEGLGEVLHHIDVLIAGHEAERLRRSRA